MKLNDIMIGPSDEEIQEAVTRAFKRVDKSIKRMFRCTSGRRAGRVVSDPTVCYQKKDPRKVRVGKRVAKQKKGIRIRKSAIRKNTAASRLVRSMNQRLSGNKPKSPLKPL